MHSPDLNDSLDSLLFFTAILYFLINRRKIVPAQKIWLNSQTYYLETA